MAALKESTVIKLTRYYRSLVISNIPDIEKTKTTVHVTLYHCMSTDGNPQYRRCFFNKATVGSEKPKFHKDVEHILLNMTVVTKILSVCHRLASRTVLARCTESKTQNRSKCLCSIIWLKSPEEKICVKKDNLFVCGRINFLVQPRVLYDCNLNTAITDAEEGVQSEELVQNKAKCQTQFGAGKIQDTRD
jgi:hypothetical protein